MESYATKPNKKDAVDGIQATVRISLLAMQRFSLIATACVVPAASVSAFEMT